MSTIKNIEKKSARQMYSDQAESRDDEYYELQAILRLLDTILILTKAEYLM